MTKESKISKVITFIGALLLLLCILAIGIFVTAVLVRICVAIWLFGWNLFPTL